MVKAGQSLGWEQYSGPSKSTFTNVLLSLLAHNPAEVLGTTSLVSHKPVFESTEAAFQTVAGEGVLWCVTRDGKGH